jgi:hypothetical protein
MKITMIRNPSRRFGCELMEGQTGEVSDNLAVSLIDAGLAVEAVTAPVQASKKKIEAVPEKPAIKGE